MNQYTEDLINDHHTNTHTHKQTKKEISVTPTKSSLN